MNQNHEILPDEDFAALLKEAKMRADANSITARAFPVQHPHHPPLQAQAIPPGADLKRWFEDNTTIDTDPRSWIERERARRPATHSRDALAFMLANTFVPPRTDAIDAHRYATEIESQATPEPDIVSPTKDPPDQQALLRALDTGENLDLFRIG
jgi:hypothetical protein